MVNRHPKGWKYPRFPTDVIVQRGACYVTHNELFCESALILFILLSRSHELLPRTKCVTLYALVAAFYGWHC